jgi:hypothetical protein
MRKSWSGSFVILLGAALLIALCLGVFIIWRSGILSFSMEDGPFHGRPATEVPARDPDQVFPISSKFTLQVFDDPEGKCSPIVRLVDRAGKTRWAIYADGWEPDDVRSIRFEKSCGGLLRSCVEGTVDWIFGKEATWWYISRTGRLREYWYSW